MMGFGFGGVGMLLFWLVIVAIVVLAIRGLMSRSSGKKEPEESALDILRRRYAVGDISSEEYRQRRKELTDA